MPDLLSADARLERLEASLSHIQEVLNDSLALIDRLRELEVERRRKKGKKRTVRGSRNR